MSSTNARLPVRESVAIAVVGCSLGLLGYWWLLGRRHHDHRQSLTLQLNKVLPDRTDLTNLSP